MIGDNIKKIREDNNLSLTELADKIGISRPYLSLIESNQRTNIKTELLNKISETLNVPLSMLLGEEPQEEIPIGYLHIAREAQQNGLTPDDVKFAIDWLIEAKKRSDKVKKERDK
jgi:XRE family transcriptional regulator, master regulator for biofilm formation